MSAHVTRLVLRQSAGVSSHTGLGAPLRLERGGQAPHAHCAPGLAGLCHAEPLRMVHWPLRGSQGAPSAAQDRPAVRVLSGVAQARMPALYASADAVVLPSRGEGWGRPHVEAMATGTPVIATNWSGPVAYLDEANGYPLRYDGLEAVPDGPFKGHLWAAPSVAHLRELMRAVVADPAGRAAKGAQARLDMVSRFSHAAVGALLKERLGQRAAVKDRGEL